MPSPESHLSSPRALACAIALLAVAGCGTTSEAGLSPTATGSGAVSPVQGGAPVAGAAAPLTPAASTPAATGVGGAAAAPLAPSMAAMPAAMPAANPNPQPSAPGAAPGSAPPAPDAQAAGASADLPWEEIIGADWTLAPGQETTLCWTQTLSEDVYVHGFAGSNPLGTHHSIFAAGAGGVDGRSMCPGGAPTGGQTWLFGSTLGTNDVIFPDGVAIKLSKGMHIVIALHLFNTGTEMLAGRSATRVLRMEPDQVKMQADYLQAGSSNINLPPGVETKVVGGCTMDADVSVFAIQPHMHQSGVHSRVWVETDDGEVMLHDGPYSFEEQVYYPLNPPLQVARGKRVRIECTYMNTTDRRLVWGESSTDEMCQTSVYRYPATPGVKALCTF